MRCGLLLSIAGVLALIAVASAAAGWAGTDPAQNYPISTLPVACAKAPTGKKCINAGVYYLDKARAKVGLPAYKLPADFPSLTPAEQMFILTNLDRVQYGLPPITGLTAALSQDALVRGVKAGADPSPSSTAGVKAWNANWAGGWSNAPMAYEGWMWNDGVGSANIDCTAAHKSGCWGHRHNILWKFGANAVLAMGAAAGVGPSHGPAYAMILVAGGASYKATYSYTWSSAVADGAGTNSYKPGNLRR
jgi:hypothetical protein